MTDLDLASSRDDAETARLIEQEHAELLGTLDLHTERLLTAMGAGDAAAVVRAQSELVGWFREILLPHVDADEEALYPAGRSTPEGRLLVESLLTEHDLLSSLVDDVETESAATGIIAAAGALRALLRAHVVKETGLLIPLLAATPEVSLADLHEQVRATEERAHERADEAAGHTCGCGAAEEPTPELDARSIPHAIRHATIFGALGGVAPGAAMVLVAPHDPLPLLAQIHDRWPDRFEVSYLERGPEAWRLAFQRAA